MVLHQEDVQPDQPEGDDRQDGHVEGVEADEGVAGHIHAPPEKSLDEPPDEGKGAGPARRHPDRGKGALVPEQQIAAQTEEDRDAQEDESGQPDEFPGLAVGLQEQRAEEVDEQKDDGQLRPPVVAGAEEPAHVQFGDDLDDALVGEIDMGDVVQGHQHPRHELDDEQEKRDPAGVVEEIVPVLGDELALRQPLHPFQVVALFQPVFKPWAVQP